MHHVCGQLREHRPLSACAGAAEPAAQRPRWIIITLGLCGATVPLTVTAGPDFWPSGEQWRDAAVGALTDPYSWIPAAGAAVTGLTGLDRTIADWAVDETPLFGSPESADDASDYLVAATHVAMLASAVAVPAPWKARLRRMLVEEAATVATEMATNVLKGATDRQRPDASDEKSFPSGHSAHAFVYTAMGSMNIEALPVKEPVQTGLQVGLTSLATVTAWARVEAGIHYPSDVLFGAALGNFMGHLIQGAFFGEQQDLQVNWYFADDTSYLSLNVRLQ